MIPRCGYELVSGREPNTFAFWSNEGSRSQNLKDVLVVVVPVGPPAYTAG